MTTTPKALIFDIGNVLITWNPERLYGKLMSEEAREALFAKVDLHGMNDRIDCGAPFRETVYATAEKFPHHGDHIRMWHDRWIEMASPVIDGSWKILRHMRAAGVPVFALSNFGVESFAHAETCYPELKEFDRRFISGHMKVIKPAARIYEMVEEESGLAGSELFFTDDRADNIAAAEARGWIGHRFDGPEGLAQAVDRYFGVSVPLD
ncbi:HAD-IA family hydrolase [Algicella marina]|uniref:HAD-IA family hydrolase n=1 Tax=Algicella marina TaxID=2683284 RepID=A0A6P1T3S2_9RHOB|nr:HAD-IA family hydrolase [Algicella marina]QHQ36360.1 HAD-IA family hydrolase [Algicella marina]